jgi:hypothetical protein
VAEDPDLHRGRKLFYQALDNFDLIPDGIEAFAKTVERFPIESRMYTAVLHGLSARATIWPLRKLRIANAAILEIDGIPVSPEQYEARILRATMLYALPGFFEREPGAIKELTELASNFDRRTENYPDYVRAKWLEFFLKEKFLPIEAENLALYRKLGGDTAEFE